MNCKCESPKKKTILIMNKEVDVCAKSLNGCGNEIMEIETKRGVQLDPNAPIYCPVVLTAKEADIARYNHSELDKYIKTPVKALLL